MSEITPIAGFNRGVRAGTVFSLDTDLYAFDDETTVQEINDTTPDDAVVLASPQCDCKVTAGQVRAARAGASHLTLPGGLVLGFYATVVLV